MENISVCFNCSLKKNIGIPFQNQKITKMEMFKSFVYFFPVILSYGFAVNAVLFYRDPVVVGSSVLLLVTGVISVMK